MGPVQDGALADMDLVRSNGAQLDMTPQNQLLVTTLAARARAGEVLADEPARLVLAKYRLDHWTEPPSFPFLPLPTEEVAQLVPPAVFGSGRHHVERKGENTEVVITLKLGDDRANTGGQVQTVVENAIGLAAFATLGVGFISVGGDDGTMRTQVQHRIRMRLYSEQNGTRMSFTRQKDNDPPVALDPKTLLRLYRQMYLIRSVYCAYYTVLAVYGPWATGMPAMRVTQAGLVGRLKALGLAEPEATQQAVELLAELRPRRGRFDEV